ncbi:MAG: 5'/3'-nucleotidase SurE [Rhizobiaceae bacterium]|nr:5'/3'-nucleotidase SurE [Rhizobiaceae bacterium]MBL4732990.1 5'/3'-nucleotidase SurE [Rhizobiaceae bacterium]
MRILLVNDDGIHARGLVSLEKIAREFTDDIWIVAPESDQSGLAHSLTLNDPLRLRKIEDKKFALKGTPTDCVIMGVRELMDGAPDLILSGVNSGHNIGDDVTYSGTVAGAMEGTLLGIRSIALSQGYNWADGVRAVPWEVSEAHGPGVVAKLLETDFPDKSFVNINFPNCGIDEVTGIEATRQGVFTYGLSMEKRHDGRGFPYYWLRFGREIPDQKSHADISVLQENKISVSALQLDLTHESFRSSLEELFSKG